MTMTVTMIKMRTQVKEASCYGNLANCEAPAQKCCKTTYERVCQQVCSFYDLKWNYGKKSYSLCGTNWMACMYRLPFNWSHFALLVNTVRRSTRKIIQGSNESSSGGEHDNSRTSNEEAGLPDGWANYSKVQQGGNWKILGNWQIEKFKGIGCD